MIHDHGQGDIPHDHEPALAHPQSPFHGEGLLTFGIVGVVAGGLLYLWQNSNHSTCSSVLVQAASPSQCQAASNFWTLGVALLVVGAVLAIVGAILRSRA